ncbi:MAG: redoxin domain-containing protein, partial [Phycisphaerae bacterium]
MKAHSFRIGWTAFLLAVVAFLPARAVASPKDRIGEELKDVTLKKLTGESVDLLDLHDRKALVIAYMGVGCPISGRYAPRLEALSKKFGKKGVRVVGINANPQDSPESIAAEVKALGVSFEVLRDPEQVLTRQLDAKTTTVVFLVDKDKKIRYRGMIDDQYAIAAQRDKPRNKYLERAIRAVLRGKTPHTPRTVAPGCLITRVKNAPPPQEVTYSSHIARIMQDRCQSCHRPTQIAPFPLTSYKAVRGWSAMIHSVLTEGRMPPWNAAKEFDGVFLNERKIPEEEK